MNAWNGVVIFVAWVAVACAAGGTYLGHDRNIAFVILFAVTALLTVVLSGSDREDS